MRSMSRTFRFLLLAALAGLLTASSVASAKTRIAWSRADEAGTRNQIVSANPDGSDLRRVTRVGKDVFDIDPVISPDGTQIAFERDRPESEIFEVGLVEADGDNERVLDLGCVDPCASDLMPGWLHDGSGLTYTPVIGPFDRPNDSAASAVLHTAALDGSGVQRFSEPGIDGVFEDYHARFSADGSYLVFVRIRNADLHVAIFRMDADGTDVRRLTPWNLDADLADISLATSGPTEDLVVFETYGMGAPKGKNSNLATVPATCPSPAECRERIRYVTHHGDGRIESFNPSWAPNGRRIAYVRFAEGDRKHPPVGDIWTIRPDGGDRRAVSTSPRFEFRPDWGRAPASDHAASGAWQ
jgi:Tol biopolymer transport system component